MNPFEDVFLPVVDCKYPLSHHTSPPGTVLSDYLYLRGTKKAVILLFHCKTDWDRGVYKESQLVNANSLTQTIF